MEPLKGAEDGDPKSVLGDADTVLIIEGGVKERLDFSLLPRFGISGDIWIIFIEGGIVLIEQCRYPRSILVGRIGEDEAGKFPGFQTGKED